MDTVLLHHSASPRCWTLQLLLLPVEPVLHSAPFSQPWIPLLVYASPFYYCSWHLLCSLKAQEGASRKTPSSRKGTASKFLLGHAPSLTSDSLPQLLGFLTVSNDSLANRGLLFSKIQNFYTKTIPQALQHFLHLLHTNHTWTTWQE